MKPNGRDCISDHVLKQLADSDHDTLILARRLRARGPHTEGFQTHDVHGHCEDNGSNQGHISDMRAFQPEPDDKETVPSRTDSAPPPPVSPRAVLTATGTQQRQPRRQDSIPPPRWRDSQPPATFKDAGVTSGLDPIAESAAKDDERRLKRLIKLMGELNATVQAAERAFDLAHNAQGGMIRMPDSSYNQDIHQDVRELLERGNSTELGELRRFQETSMKMNRMITVSGVVTERYSLTQASGSTRSNESS